MNEAKLKQAFDKVKHDMEGVKNELAFALRRIAKIEESLTKRAIEETISEPSKNKKKKL